MRHWALAACVALIAVSASGAAQEGAPRGAPGGRGAGGGLQGDDDPAGALIEVQRELKLTSEQFAALRALRHTQQRFARAVRDSLVRLGASGPGLRTGAPSGAREMPAREMPAGEGRSGARALMDTLRVVTMATRDSAMRVLTAEQRTQLAAIEMRMRDSTGRPGRQGPSSAGPGRPPQ